MLKVIANTVRRIFAPNQPPQTMNMLGLRFLQALAAQRKSGVYLEVGPLFGSSTNAIAAGRRDASVPIHTIDTFEAAPWVRRRFGIDLSRARFDQFTKGIKNLQVHQGYAPDVVRDTWSDQIGFYFDDATHGDPGWSDNYRFFSPYFTDDCLICGDDFARRWPDIIRNVHSLAADAKAQLYVMGIVWAFTKGDPSRIEAAVKAASPALAAASLTTKHKDVTRTNLAACWSWGLFRAQVLQSFAITANGSFSGEVVALDAGQELGRVALDGTPLSLEGVTEIRCDFDKPIALQFSLVNAKGRALKTGDFIGPRGSYLVPEGHKITGLRLFELSPAQRLLPRPLRALRRFF